MSSTDFEMEVPFSWDEVYQVLQDDTSMQLSSQEESSADSSQNLTFFISNEAALDQIISFSESNDPSSEVKIVASLDQIHPMTPTPSPKLRKSRKQTLGSVAPRAPKKSKSTRIPLYKMDPDDPQSAGKRKNILKAKSSKDYRENFKNELESLATQNKALKEENQQLKQRLQDALKKNKF